MTRREGAPRPLLPVMAVLGLLGLAMLAAAFGNPSIEALPGQLVPTTGAPAPERALPDESGAASASGTATDSEATAPSSSPPAATLVLLGLLVVAGVSALGWRLHRGRWTVGYAAAAQPQEVRRLVWTAVEQGLHALSETDTDPRRAVIACWSRLESTAAEAGTRRGPGDTSTDLVLKLLSDHDVSAEVLAGFAEIYREARFATHVVDDTMRTQARTALRQLRDELGAGVRG
jgi:hypothetical protein